MIGRRMPGTPLQDSLTSTPYGTTRPFSAISPSPQFHTGRSAQIPLLGHVTRRKQGAVAPRNVFVLSAISNWARSLEYITVSSSILPRPSRLTLTLFEYGGLRDRNIEGNDIRHHIRNRNQPVCTFRIRIHAHSIFTSADASGTEPRSYTRQTGMDRGHYRRTDPCTRSDAALARGTSGLLLSRGGPHTLQAPSKGRPLEVHVVHDAVGINSDPQRLPPTTSSRNSGLCATRNRATWVPRSINREMNEGSTAIETYPVLPRSKVVT